MNSRFFGANPLHEPMMIYWLLEHKAHTIIKAISRMMTSSNGNIFCVPAHLYGNSPATGEFPAQRPVTRSFDVFFDLRLNKRLSKQWCGWWFETPSRPSWPHRNVTFPTLWPSSLIYHHCLQCYAELFAVSLLFVWSWFEKKQMLYEHLNSRVQYYTIGQFLTRPAVHIAVNKIDI